MAGKTKRSGKQVLLRFAFVAYVVWMLWLLFGQRWGTQIYTQELARNINLTPLATIRHYIALVKNSGSLRTHAVINLVGNVVMFVPLGYCLPKIFPRFRNFFKTFIFCFLLIVAVEVTQYFTYLGTCDIDDLILNMAGVILGYLFARIKQ